MKDNLVLAWDLNPFDLKEEINDYLEKGFKLYGEPFNFKKRIDHCSCGYCIMEGGHKAYGVYMIDKSIEFERQFNYTVSRSNDSRSE